MAKPQNWHPSESRDLSEVGGGRTSAMCYQPGYTKQWAMKMHPFAPPPPLLGTHFQQGGREAKGLGIGVIDKAARECLEEFH